MWVCFEKCEASAAKQEEDEEEEDQEKIDAIELNKEYIRRTGNIITTCYKNFDYNLETCINC